jgi:hypothetical protein
LILIGKNLSISHSIRTIDHRKDYQIHFRSKLKLNEDLAGDLGEYEAGPGWAAATVVSIAHRLVFETNAADDIYFFSTPLKSRSS